MKEFNKPKFILIKKIKEHIKFRYIVKDQIYVFELLLKENKIFPNLKYIDCDSFDKLLDEIYMKCDNRHYFFEIKHGIKIFDFFKLSPLYYFQSFESICIFMSLYSNINSSIEHIINIIDNNGKFSDIENINDIENRKHLIYYRLKKVLELYDNIHKKKDKLFLLYLIYKYMYYKKIYIIKEDYFNSFYLLPPIINTFLFQYFYTQFEVSFIKTYYRSLELDNIKRLIISNPQIHYIFLKLSERNKEIKILIESLDLRNDILLYENSLESSFIKWKNKMKN